MSYRVVCKPECVGQTHLVHGYLVAGAVYEIDGPPDPNGPFEPAPEPKHKNKKEAD